MMIEEREMIRVRGKVGLETGAFIPTTFTYHGRYCVAGRWRAGSFLAILPNNGFWKKTRAEGHNTISRI